MTTDTTPATKLIQWVKTNPLLTILCSLLGVLFSVFMAVMFSETVEKSIGQLLGLGLPEEAQDFMFLGLVGLLVLVLANFLWVFLFKEPKWTLDRLGASDKFQALKFLGLSMGGILFVIQIAISSEVNQNAEQGLRQERLKNAIEHLGNSSDAMRLGGGYELFHLAQDVQELRQTVFDILSAHIRWTTGESEYRKEYRSRPSEEILSLLTLLFVQDHKVFEGIKINLKGSRLPGANLKRAELQGANLEGAHLQGANLERAHLQGAKLKGAHLQGANLKGAHLQGANLEGAHLQKAMLEKANLRRADLRRAHLQGATLERAHLQEASLQSAHLQGANLEDAHLQKARLSKAHLEGANLESADLQGAKLQSAYLQGAKLRKAHLHEAKLRKAHLQGVTSSRSNRDSSFAKHMRSRISQQSDFSKVGFAGGLEDKDLHKIVKGLRDEQAKNLREQLEPHIDKPASNELPENSGAITGAYTEEEAEQWIAEYEDAMSAVPKADNGQ